MEEEGGEEKAHTKLGAGESEEKRGSGAEGLNANSHPHWRVQKEKKEITRWREAGECAAAVAAAARAGYGVPSCV